MGYASEGVFFIKRKEIIGKDENPFSYESFQSALFIGTASVSYSDID